MSQSPTSDFDSDEAIQEALNSIIIDPSERVPCRQLTYNTVTWPDEEINRQPVRLLTSLDEMSVVGVGTGERKDQPTQPFVKVIHPDTDHEEIDISKVLEEDHVAEVDARWASTRQQFDEFMKRSTEQEAMMNEAIADLRSLEMPEMYKPSQVVLPERSPSPASVTSLHLSDVSDESDQQLLADDQTLLEGCNNKISNDIKTMILKAESNRLEIDAIVEEEFSHKIDSQKQKADALQALFLQSHPQPDSLPDSSTQELQKQQQEEVEKEERNEEQDHDEVTKAFINIGLEIAQTNQRFTAINDEVITTRSNPPHESHQRLALQIAEQSAQFELDLQQQEQIAMEKINQERIELEEKQRKCQEEREKAREAIEAEDKAQAAKQEEELRAAKAESRTKRKEERKRQRIILENKECLMMECSEADTLLYLERCQQNRQREEALLRARKLAAEQQYIDQQDSFISSSIATLRSSFSCFITTTDGILTQCSELKKLHITHVNDRNSLYTTSFFEKNNILKQHRTELDELIETFEMFLANVQHEWQLSMKSEKVSRTEILSSESNEYEKIVLEACEEQAAVHKIVVQSQLEATKRLTRHKAATTTAAEIDVLRSRTCEFFRKPPNQANETPRLDTLQLQRKNLDTWRSDETTSSMVDSLRKKKVLLFECSPRNNNTFEEVTPVNTEGLGKLFSIKQLLSNVVGGHSIESYEAIVLTNLSEEDIKATRKIKKLNLSSNLISKIIIQPGDLFLGCEELQLSDNKLDTGCFLRLISAFTHVASIVVDSNRITVVPEMGFLRNLRVLSIRCNCLNDAANIGSLSNLLTLDLLGNNLTVFDVSAPSSLTSVNLSRNALQSVNSVFSNCPLLRSCHLNNNRICSLPLTFRCVLLQELWIGDNQLTSVPELVHLPLLEVLYLQGNALEDVTGIRGNVNLTFVDISFNNLSDVDATTSALKNLKKISRLSINENPLWAKSATTIEPMLVAALPVLRILNSDPVTQQPQKSCPTEKTTQEGIELSLYPGICSIQNEDFAGLKKRVSKGEAVKDVAFTVETAAMCEQSFLVHAKGNVDAEGIERVWRANHGYTAHRQSRKRHVASGVISRWFRRVLQHKKRHEAAKKIQGIVRGSLLRQRLARGRWIDDDDYCYKQIEEPTFSPEIDTSHLEDMGKILTSALQSQQQQYQPPIVPTPPRASSIPQREEQHVPEPAPAPSEGEAAVPLSGATLAWSAGMNKRNKNFQKIKSKRLSEERFLIDKGKTLDSKQAAIRQTISNKSKSASSRQQPRPPKANNASCGDLEVESMSSTLSSSFRKGSLPPLQSDSSSDVAKK
eukprot:TRINITY_DN767_c1_g1_i1.p1 TRINITY_DN767_c1_g1~~TRINITY_DN767_c1_g1_i1.p1  ORF type:complete len:1319 (+),score=282.60 TRINITY_DN767_c1_g1_i1:67-4023(+)